MGLMGFLRQLKLPAPNEAFLVSGEGQGAAVEGEGSPFEEQTEDPTGQSRRDGGVEVGLEIDGSGVDTAVAVDGGGEGRTSLIGSKS